VIGVCQNPEKALEREKLPQQWKGVSVENMKNPLTIINEVRQTKTLSFKASHIS